MDPNELKGIKEDELARLGPCAVCRKPLLDRSSPSISFYRVRIERALFLPRNVERRVGMGMLMGSDALARALGPDEDLAKVLAGPKEVAIHEVCAVDGAHLMLLLGEDEP